MDAKHRAPGIAAHRQAVGRVAQLGDEAFERKTDLPFIELAMLPEPRALVVALEVAQKLDPGGADAGIVGPHIVGEQVAGAARLGFVPGHFR